MGFITIFHHQLGEYVYKYIYIYMVAVGTTVWTGVPFATAVVSAGDRFTLYSGADMTKRLASIFTSIRVPKPGNRVRQFFGAFFAYQTARIMRPGPETVLAPMRLPGNYSYGIQTHSYNVPLDPIPLEDEVWARKVASFWLVDSSTRSIKPLGLSLVVSGGLLTNKHVFDSIEAALVGRKEVYIGAVRKEVRSTLGMIKFSPEGHFGPSDKNLVAFPVSSDFTIIPLPREFSTLGIKSGGSTQFGGNSSKAVTGGFYKSDGNCWRFHRSRDNLSMQLGPWRRKLPRCFLPGPAIPLMARRGAHYLPAMASFWASTSALCPTMTGRTGLRFL